MRTLKVRTGWRASLIRAIAPTGALFLLAALVVPAEAQRGGRSGSGDPGKGSGYSSHRGYGGYHSRGYGGYHKGKGYRPGHRGAYYGHGRSDYGGYRSHYRRGGYSRPHYTYRGSRLHSSYGSYRDYGHHGFGFDWNDGSLHYGVPRFSFFYNATPRYVSPRYVSPRYVSPRYVSPRYVTPRYVSPVSTSERYVSRYERYRPRYEAYALPSAPADASSTDADGAAEPFDTRPQPARLELTVEPDDASVYLDGRFLGVASELPAELWLAPGQHRLEIARPGHASQQLDLELDAGERRDFKTRLRSQAPETQR